MTPLRLGYLILGLWMLAGSALASTPGEPLWTYRTSTSEGYSVAISENGTTIAAAAGQLYALNGKGEKLWAGFGGTKVLITADGKFVVAGTDGGIRYLDTAGRTFWDDARYRPVASLVMTPDERYIAYMGDGTASLYTSAGVLLGRNTTYSADSIAVAPDATLMVITTPDAIVGLNESGIPVWNYESFENRQLAFAPDSSYLAVVSAYSVLGMHPSGNLLWTYRTPGEVMDLAVSADSSRVVAGSLEKEVYVLDRNGKLLWSRKTGDPANCVAVTANGSLVAVGTARGLDRNVYLFSGKGDLLWTAREQGWVKDLAFSGDGQYLAAVSDDGVVSLFSTAAPPATPLPTTATPVSTGTVTITPPIPTGTVTTATSAGTATSPSPSPTGTTLSPETTAVATSARPGTTSAGGTPFTLAVLAIAAAGWILLAGKRGR